MIGYAGLLVLLLICVLSSLCLRCGLEFWCGTGSDIFGLVCVFCLLVLACMGVVVVSCFDLVSCLLFVCFGRFVFVWLLVFC